MNQRYRIAGSQDEFNDAKKDAPEMFGDKKTFRIKEINHSLADAKDRWNDATTAHNKYVREKEEIMQGLNDAVHAVKKALAKNNQGLLQELNGVKAPKSLLQQGPFADDHQSGRKEIKKTDGKKENAVVNIINNFIEDEQEEAAQEGESYEKIRGNYNAERNAYMDNRDEMQGKALD